MRGHSNRNAGILMRRLLLAPLSWFCAATAMAADVPPTLRIDYVHSGNALQDHYALERIVVEALPWPGNPLRPIDDSDRGQSFFEVVEPKSGKVLYSRGFSTVFGEWRTTEEAQKLSRAFQESLRLPLPTQPVRIRLMARDERNAFSVAWTVDVDPSDPQIERKAGPAPAPLIAVRNSGPPQQKVDLLILGDGYTDAEAAKFEADARRLSDYLFSVAPFSERAQDFNVWGLRVPASESGVSRPSNGTYRWSHYYFHRRD